MPDRMTPPRPTPYLHSYSNAVAEMAQQHNAELIQLYDRLYATERRAEDAEAKVEELQTQLHEAEDACRGLQSIRASTLPEGEYRARIDVLSMFVRRLYRKLRRYEPDAEVIYQANTYLKAIGQAGTPLRVEECAPPKEADHPTKPGMVASGESGGRP